MSFIDPGNLSSDVLGGLGFAASAGAPTTGPYKLRGAGAGVGQVRTTPGRYSIQQLEEIWLQAGGSAASAPMAAAIAMAESGGNSNALNHNTNGSIDRGLWQINSSHGQQSTTDPLANARAAVAISGDGSNWHPWSTYTNGAYKRFTNAADAAWATIRQSSGFQSTPVNAPAQAAATVAGSLGELVSFLTDPTNWLRIGEVIVGIILVAMGLRSLTGSTTTPLSVAKSVVR